MIAEGQGGKGEHKAAVVVTTRRVCLDRTHPNTFVETNMNFKIQRQYWKGQKQAVETNIYLRKQRQTQVQTKTNSYWVCSNRTHPNSQQIETNICFRQQKQIQKQTQTSSFRSLLKSNTLQHFCRDKYILQKTEANTNTDTSQTNSYGACSNCTHPNTFEEIIINFKKTKANIHTNTNKRKWVIWWGDGGNPLNCYDY